MPYLVSKNAAVMPARLQLSGGTITLGRLKSNDVYIEDALVSRRHACIRFHKGKYVIQDMESRHGISVNGDVVIERVLADGDAILLGNTVINFYEHGDAAGLGPPETAPEISGDVIETDLRVLSTDFLRKQITDTRPLATIYELALMVGSISSYEDLLKRLVSVIMGETQARVAMVARTEGRHNQLQIDIAREGDAYVKGEQLEFRRDIVERVLRSGQAVLMSQSMPAVKPQTAGLKPAICAPLKFEDKVLGVLYADTPVGGKFRDTDLWFLIVLGQLAGAAVQHAIRLRRAQIEVGKLRRLWRAGVTLVGNSKAMEALREAIWLAGNSDMCVFITGPRGAGKKQVARAIHALSERERFVPVRCAEVEPEAAEVVFLGHERHTLRSNPKRHIGLLEQARNGTLYLEDVGKLPMDSQMLLADILKRREFQRLGGAKNIKLHARLIASASDDLEEACWQGHFHRDLYERLNTLPISTPGLSARMEDLPLLVKHFTRGQVKTITVKTLTLLERHPWPGNLKQLRDVIEQALLMTESSSDPRVFERAVEDILAGEANSVTQFITLRELERRHLVRVLEATGWDAVQAAGILGVEAQALSSRIEAENLRPLSAVSRRRKRMEHTVSLRAPLPSGARTGETPDLLPPEPGAEPPSQIPTRQVAMPPVEAPATWGGVEVEGTDVAEVADDDVEVLEELPPDEEPGA